MIVYHASPTGAAVGAWFEPPETDASSKGVMPARLGVLNPTQQEETKGAYSADSQRRAFEHS